MTTRPISQRLQSLSSSPIRQLERMSQEVKAQGTHIYNLNIGQPDVLTPSVFLEQIAKEQPSLIRYSPSNGEIAMRRKVAHHFNTFYRTHLHEDHVLVTVGSSEALLFTFFALTDKGEEVLIAEPCYTNYLGFANVVETTIKTIPSSIEDGFRLPDIDYIRRKVGPKTKAILLCNPNNPTGYVYTQQELMDIATLCEEKDLFLIVDEAYRELTYDGGKPTTALKELSHISQRLIVLDTVSKRFSATGARIGFIITQNEVLLSQLLKLAGIRLSPPYIDQLGSLACLDLPSSYFSEVRSEYKSRRDAAIRELKKIDGLVCPTPEGAFYLVCELPVDDASAFCTWMLESFRWNNSTVLLTPMSGFYKDNVSLGKKQIRLAYVLKKNDLIQAIQCLKEAILAYNRR